jgi:hypothetical protein
MMRLTRCPACDHDFDAGGRCQCTPWTDQRARNGKLATLVRVIDLAADRQEFVFLAPTLPDNLMDLAFDGETVILPKALRTNAEVAEIVARFDERYWTTDKNNQTRISALARERYLHN